MVGKKRCRNHGGATPCGVASPHFVTGRYSKYVPQHLRESYEKAVADPELLSLKDEVALLKARKDELLLKMDEIKSPPWGQVLSAAKSVRQALADGEDVDGPMIELVGMIQEGFDVVRNYESSWGELRDVIQDKAKAAGAEWKRLEALNSLLTVQDVMGLAVAFLECVRLEVKDGVPAREILRRLQEHWNRLVGARAERVRAPNQLVIVDEQGTPDKGT